MTATTAGNDEHASSASGSDSDGEPLALSAGGDVAAAPRSSRTLKNKMARERRKRRKQARQSCLASAEGAAGGGKLLRTPVDRPGHGPAPAAPVTDAQRPPRAGALGAHEVAVGLHSSRLGQEQEAYVRQKLDCLASFSSLQQGYTRNAGVVIDLLQDVLDVVPGRPTAYRSIAQSIMQRLSAPAWSWRDSFVQKVLGTFARGDEEGTFICVSGQSQGSRPVPLSQLVQMDSAVHLEQYLRHANVCRQLLPQVAQPGGVPPAVQEAMGRSYMEACFYGVFMLISQPLRMGQALGARIAAAKPAAHTATLEEIAFVWDALSMDAAQHARMWAVWLAAAPRLQELTTEFMVVHRRLHRALAAHDAGSSGAYADLLDAVSQLLLATQRLLGVRLAAETQILYMMEPYQAAVLATLQLPRMSIQSILASGTLPFASPMEIVLRLGDPAAATSRAHAEAGLPLPACLQPLPA